MILYNTFADHFLEPLVLHHQDMDPEDNRFIFSDLGTGVLIDGLDFLFRLLLRDM